MRYYYTDALASAWMAKHFGMRFIGDKGFPIQWGVTPSMNILCGDIVEHNWSEDMSCEQSISVKAYLHPDSVHLIKPKVGDLIRSKHAVGTWANSSKESTVVAEKLLFDYWELNGVPEFLQIVQRNGVAFMWPETESAMYEGNL